MKHTKRITTLLLALVMMLTIAPAAKAATYEYAVEGGNLKFDPSTGTISGCDTSVYSAEIPSEIYGAPVTAIGNNAFLGCRKLTTVTIPNSVTSIGSGAFYNCPLLTSVSIPDSVTSIGSSTGSWSVFGDCKSLETVSIPGSVKEIKSRLFSNCESLKTVSFGEGIENVKYLFQNCNALESVTLPDSLKEIPTYAFQSCKNLTSVTIGSGVKSIENNAFSSCPALESLYFRGNAPGATDKIINKFAAGFKIYYPKGASGWKSPTWNGYITEAYTLPGMEPAPEPEPEPAPAPAPTVAGFTDVAANSPFKDAIAWAVAEEITKGTSATTFGPSNTCTHNHILTFLWRVDGCPAAQGGNDFARAVAWAKSQGLLSGSFDGGAPCTRSQTMVYLWKWSGSPETAVNDTFTDVPAGTEAAQAIAWAVKSGITKGTSAATFSPDATCTRGQIVTFLYRAYA